MSKGIDFVDLHLLAAISLSSEAHLWTKDKRLQCIADELEFTFSDRAFRYTFRVQEYPFIARIFSRRALL